MKMKIRPVILIITIIILSSCHQNNGKTLIRINNYQNYEVFVEIWGYPAKEFTDNKAGIFDGFIKKDSLFILECDEKGDIDELTELASPVYSKTEYEGFEILVYRSEANEVIIFGDTPKDTLHFERISVNKLIKDRPKEINIK